MKQQLRTIWKTKVSKSQRPEPVGFAHTNTQDAIPFRFPFIPIPFSNAIKFSTNRDLRQAMPYHITGITPCHLAKDIRHAIHYEEEYSFVASKVPHLVRSHTRVLSSIQIRAEHRSKPKANARDR